MPDDSNQTSDQRADGAIDVAALIDDTDDLNWQGEYILTRYDEVAEDAAAERAYVHQSARYHRALEAVGGDDSCIDHAALIAEADADDGW